MSNPKTITMLELRENAEKVVKAVQGGQRLILTYRGRPAMRLEPVQAETVEADDPFYRLAELASGEGAPLTNAEIDRLVYGS